MIFLKHQPDPLYLMQIAINNFSFYISSIVIRTLIQRMSQVKIFGEEMAIVMKF